MIDPPAPSTRKPAARPRVRTRLSREEKKVERAKALLDAAWLAFCELGYEKLTVEDVADRAGYSRQPVYTLFGDKQNLIFELQSRATTQVMDLLFAHLRQGANLRDNLARLAQIVAEQLSSSKPTYGEQLLVVAQTIALNRPDIAAKLQFQARWVIDEIARVIRRWPLADGDTLRNEPEVIAAHLAAHINGLTTVQYQTGQRYAQAKDLEEIFLFLALGEAASSARRPAEQARMRTAAIIGGGLSQRLGGQDKLLVEIDGQRQLDRLLAALATQSDAQLLISNRPAASYAGLSIPVVPDRVADAGPLAGIHAALHGARTPSVLCVPADLALVPPDLATRLAAAREHANAPAACVHDGVDLQPICCLLDARLADAAQRALDAGQLALHRWLRSVGVVEVDYAHWPRWAWSFNTPDELESVRAHVEALRHAPRCG